MEMTVAQIRSRRLAIEKAIVRNVEGTISGPALKDKVVQKAPAKPRKTGRRRPTRTTRKVQLWAECKKADPEKAKSLSYRKVKTQDLEKFLAKVRKAK